MPNAHVRRSGCIFQTPRYNSMQAEGFGSLRRCATRADMLQMYQYWHFFLSFETCQTYCWVKAHFQTCTNSVNGLKWGGIFAYISVNGDLTLQFIENLSPETWSRTEMRCVWFWWALQLLPRVSIHPSVVWARHVQPKLLRASLGSSLEKQYEQRRII